MGAVLVVDGVSRSFGPALVLADCSLRIEPGELVVLRGANGAGKTTLLRCIVGLDRPGRGAIEIDGAPPSSARAKRCFTWLPDQPVLYDDLSVVDNVVFTAQAFGIRDPRAEAAAALRRFGLAGHEGKAPPTLSRGLRQRAALARGFCRPWALAILDEPFSGLDDEGRATLVDHLAASVAEGRSVLLTSHDDAAVAVATRTMQFAGGHLVADG